MAHLTRMILRFIVAWDVCQNEVPDARMKALVHSWTISQDLGLI